MNTRRWAVVGVVLLVAGTVWAAAKDGAGAGVERRLSDVEKRLDALERKLGADHGAADAGIALRVDRLETAMTDVRDALRQAGRQDVAAEVRRMESSLSDTRRMAEQLERRVGDLDRGQGNSRAEDAAKDAARAVDSLKDAVSDLKSRVSRLESK